MAGVCVFKKFLCYYLHIKGGFMTHIINIKEENNKLELVGDYSPIVCGNSNYVLKFNFSTIWAQSNSKTAIFLLGGEKILVNFSGDECAVPTLKNAPFLMVSLTAGVGNAVLASTCLKLELIPTILGENLPEAEHLSGFLTRFLSALNKVEHGDFEAKYAGNVINENLLINGNFVINQRDGGTEANPYTATSSQKFAVDRWSINNGTSVVKVYNGVKISFSKIYGYFRQKIENSKILAGKTVTATIKISNSSFNRASRVLQIYQTSPTVSGTQPTQFITGDGIYKLTVALVDDLTEFDVRIINYVNGNQTDTFTLEWAKLEVGDRPTEFVPRPYAEELSMCQRYYQHLRINGNSIYVANANSIYPCIPLITTMRTKPTVTVVTYPSIRGNGSIVGNLVHLVSDTLKDNLIQLFSNLTTSGSPALVSHQIYILANGEIALDAEIY